MQKLLILLTVFFFSYAASALAAEPAAYVAGKDYSLITPIQPTDTVDKLEVVEIFWYGCPHCHQFEPTLGPWTKDLPEDVGFYRLPAIFSPLWEVHARAYFTADILNVLDESHSALFHVLHVKRKKLSTLEKLADFYVQYGVDKALFEKTYHSFVVNTRVARAKEMVTRYGVEGVPAMVVNGKYLITGPMAKSYENMLRITDFLLAKERALK
ncbi:MAG: thiol:disulfide interchange protein DsbA/DsbL [Cycloclasticus sp.]|nr:disulfide bond formation protein DsbA [Cycloclasticus sp. 46_83_sub15_T18]OUR82171.1 disulfide bond formation protein DsbA [Cycloclasticus sp. 46_120_T64]